MKKGLIYGRGINDADYFTQQHMENGKLWVCPYYLKWKSILCRCYSEYYQRKMPTYIGCTVCDEWLKFSNFKKWMETQDWEGKQIDKDFLVEGNKVYSPETCIFIPQNINAFLTLAGARRGKYLLGVTKQRSDTFVSRIREDGDDIYLGRYSTEYLAHRAWQEYKLMLAKRYRDAETDERFLKGLNRVVNKLENALENNLIIDKL